MKPFPVKIALGIGVGDGVGDGVGVAAGAVPPPVGPQAIRNVARIRLHSVSAVQREIWLNRVSMVTSIL